MKTIAYHCPFVPPEWIAAHGLRPHWMRLRAAGDGQLPDVVRGVCPFARAFLHAAISGIEAAGIVMATTCDQMRHAAELLSESCDTPVFLLDVPATWQTRSSRDYYREELERLGRFLTKVGGNTPAPGELARIMLAYQSARQSLRAVRDRLSGRQFVEAVVAIRGNGNTVDHPGSVSSQTDGIRLAIVGGPLLEEDHAILDMVEATGGRLVLDATEGGERTLPGEFDEKRTEQDPLAELADVYNRTIPDAFRRPNDRLHEWIAREVAARKVRGILFRRFTWCDIWHAELHRLKENNPVPILDIDACHDDGLSGRTTGRIEAFLEMLG